MLPRPALPLVPRGAGVGLADAGDAEDDDEDPGDSRRMLEAQNTKLEMALKALKWKRLKQSVLVQRKASSPMVADGDRVVPSYIHQRRLVEPPGAAQSAAHLKGWQHSLDLVAKQGT